MKIPKAVAKETKNIAIGVGIGDLAVILVFLILNKFDYTVIAGLLLGSCAAIGNFFYLGMSVQKAVQKGENAKKYMYMSYTKRMVIYGACVVIAGISPMFHVVAAVLPLFMPRLVIYVLQFSGYYKPEEFENEKDGDSQV